MEKPSCPLLPCFSRFRFHKLTTRCVDLCAPTADDLATNRLHSRSCGYSEFIINIKVSPAAIGFVFEGRPLRCVFAVFLVVFSAVFETFIRLPRRKDTASGHIKIVEDIVDSGLTILSALESLKKKSPKSIRVASLLLKPDALKFDVPVDYIGFRIPNDFIVGYGLDYNEYGRDLPGIYRLVSE